MRRHFGKRGVIAVSIFLGLFGLSLFACQRDIVRTVEETPSDHPHRLPDTKVVGDYHVSFLLDHRRGEIEIFVTDAQERPVPLEEPFIKGVIVTSAGASREIRLEPAQYRRRRLVVGRASLRRPDDHTNPRIRSEYVPYSAVFRYQADWLIKEHDYSIEVEVPINNVMHKASFDFSTSEEEDRHHRH